MPKKHVYRPGDRVRVVTPKVFLRCGYPYDIVKEGEHIQDAFAEDIVALIDKMDPRLEPTFVRYKSTPQLLFAVEETPFIPVGLKSMWVDYRDLCSRFARIIARRRGFGGRERAIYTEERPDLAGQALVVYGKFNRKTGVYFPPGQYGDDYEPGGLAHEQTHVILRCHTTGGPFLTPYEFHVSQDVTIEAANVEPIAEPGVGPSA